MEENDDNAQQLEFNIKRKSAKAENASAPFSFVKEEDVVASEKQEKANQPCENISKQIEISEAIETEMQNKTSLEFKLSNSEDADRQVKDSEEKVSNQRSKKKKIMSFVFLLINIAIVAIILVSQISGDNVMSLKDIIATGFNWGYLSLCFVFFIIIAIMEGLRLNVLLKHISGKSRPFLSFKTGLVGRYYDCITPMSTGGQPFQIFYMKNRGVKAPQAIAVPIGKYVFHQISYVILTTIVIFSTLFSAGSVSSGGVIVSTASWVGYILTAGLLAIIIFLSISKRLGAKLVAGILKIGKKMHLVKNYDKVYNSVMKTVDDFQSTMKFYAKSPKTFIKSFLYAFSSMILNYTLPFLIYCTFAGFNPSLWSDIFVKCVMIDLASGFIPLPGGTGMAELSFTALFASLFTEGRLFWALILWRILTYYGYIISGLLVMFYDYVIGNRRYNWQKKKWSLEKESEEFKSEQIEMFKKKIKKQQKNKN